MSESEITNESNKFIIVLCAIYDKKKHGFTADSDPNIHGQYLVLESYRYINSHNYFIENSLSNSRENIYELCEWYNKFYGMSFRRTPNQRLNRQYFIKPEIAECFYLSGQEKVAILKTFWLRLIKRKWKKIFAQRKEIIEKRKQVSNIIYWQMRGTWPNNCRTLPNLYGMLGCLK